MNNTQVIVVGAGPVGLTLSLALSDLGVRCILLERNEAPSGLPKMERCNARTMEIYRRLGIVNQIRAAGLPADCPMVRSRTARKISPHIMTAPARSSRIS